MRFSTMTIASLMLTATLSSFAHAANADRLANTDWEVISYNNGKAMFSSLKTSKMNVSFSEKNRISGFSGCNKFMGTYKIPTSQKITVSPLGQTRMACENKELAQEEIAFINAWKQVATYKLRGSKLTLANKKGQAIIQLKVAE